MDRLRGRVAVVTGGASGIGRAIAERFAGEGARVAVVDLNGEGAEQVARTIAAGGGTARAHRTDVADSAEVEALFTRVTADWGTVDVLSNNAGVGQLSPALQSHLLSVAGEVIAGARRSLGVTSRMDDAEWRRMVEIHLFGTFYCTRAALRIMEQKNSGVIVNMASVAGLAGIPGLAHYGAAKAGIIGFTKSVAMEAGSGNIRVNAIAPGFIDTPMTADIPPFLRQMTTLRTPLGRVGTADEIAAVAVFLASDEASFVTGQVVSPNGGLHT
ncbi:MAG: SDR family oxidoreductase [Deltaproteobacteria bacterium]|nr:MAG: SDR family oxidoreductase [Deltaproteobacteria bacterium]